MTEQKPFAKTVPLTDAEMKSILKVDQFGVRLTLKDVVVGKHIIMKIEGPVVANNYKQGEKDRTNYSLLARYYPQGNPDGFELKVQIGKGAVDLLNKRWPDNTYVGKMAFFKQSLYQGQYPQFVTPFEGKARVAPKLDDLFGSAESEEESPEIPLDAKPNPFIVQATVSFDQLIQKGDIMALIESCVQQGDKFVQAFAGTVMIKGTPFHNDFKTWIDANAAEGHISTKLSTADCERLYELILSKVTKR